MLSVPHSFKTGTVYNINTHLLRDNRIYHKWQKSGLLVAVTIEIGTWEANEVKTRFRAC